MGIFTQIAARLPHLRLQINSTTRQRRRPRFHGYPVAAEVLELRKLLTTPNVTAIVSGTALTLNCDNNGNHDIDVFRSDATHVEIVASNGSTVNGSTSAVLNLSTVSGITVNLGNGYDTVGIDSHFADPALNIGAGGIVFQGSGGTGDYLTVSNGSAGPMAILGSVTVQGVTPGSPLIQDGSTNSTFYLFTAGGGNLTVDGNVSANVQGSGAAAYEDNDIFSAGAGALVIQGSVTQTSTETSTGYAENDVEVTALGNVTIDGNVTQTAVTTGGGSSNHVEGNYSIGGNLTIGMNLKQTSGGSSATQTVENDVESILNNKVTIKQTVTQIASSPTANIVRNLFDLQGKGNVSVNGNGVGLTQVATGNVDCYNYLDVTGSGNMSITGAVSQISLGGVPSNVFYDDGTGNLSVSALTQTAHSTSGAVANKIFSDGSGAVTIGSGGIVINVQLNESTAPVSPVTNSIYTAGKGSLKTTGLVQISTTNNSAAPDTTTNTIDTNGNTSAVLSLGGVSINNFGPQSQKNIIASGGAAITIGASGVKINGSTGGGSDDEITTNAILSPITIGGPVSVTEPGGGNSVFKMIAGYLKSFITVTGNVSYDNHLNATKSTDSNVSIFGANNIVESELQINGSLTLALAQTTGTPIGDNVYATNHATIGFDPAPGPFDHGYGTIISGQTIITGGNGPDIVAIKNALLGSSVTINLKNNPNAVSPSTDSLEIDGSYVEGAVTTTMTGPNAQININNVSGTFPTTFVGAFTADMSGASPRINVSTASSDNAVDFDDGAKAIGASGGGGEFIYHAANVTGTITLTHFTKVLV